MVAMLEPMVFILLLTLSGTMYIWAFISLAFQRALPDDVAPPRVTLVALGFCAAKAILGPGNAWLQMPLTVLVLVPCLYAVGCILRNVAAARRKPLFQRKAIDRWAAVMIPPIFSVALLSLQLTITDAQTGLLIDAFIFVNLLPAFYLLTQLPVAVDRARLLLVRKRA